MTDVPPEYDSAKIHDLVYTVEDCERHRRELEKDVRRPAPSPPASTTAPSKAQS